MHKCGHWKDPRNVTTHGAMAFCLSAIKLNATLNFTPRNNWTGVYYNFVFLVCLFYFLFPFNFPRSHSGICGRRSAGQRATQDSAEFVPNEAKRDLVWSGESTRFKSLFKMNKQFKAHLKLKTLIRFQPFLTFFRSAWRSSRHFAFVLRSLEHRQNSRSK